MRWLLGLVVLLGACAPDELEVVFEEDFECCADLGPWTADRPDVAAVDGFHAGEHALHIPGPGRVTRALGTPLALEDGAEARLVTDCHWGDDDGTWRELEATIEGGTVLLRLSPQDYDLDMYPQAAPVPGPARVDAVAVVDVRGDCTVDAIRIVQPAAVSR